MRADDVKTFLRLCGISDKDIREERDWVNCPCIFAEWAHNNGIDTRPSFGISVNDEGKSVYYCFSCSTEAQPLARVLHSFWLLSGEYPYELAEFYSEAEIFSEHDADTQDPWLEVPEQIKHYPLPQKILELYPTIKDSNTPFKQMCLAYLTQDRQINPSLEAVGLLRMDEKNEAILYPLTDFDGSIYALQARSIFQKRIWFIKAAHTPHPDIEFFTTKVTGAMFGADLCDLNRQVILVEGAEDRLRLLTLGAENVISTGTSNPSPWQVKKLSVFPHIIVGYDDDQAGEAAYDRFKSVFPKYPIGKLAV